MMDEVFGVFPTPVLRAAGALEGELVQGLLRHFAGLADSPNAASGALSHTRLLRPADSPLLGQVAARITPRIVDIGALMFGQRLGWSIKEMWVNLMDGGGHQAMHQHANSFVSGVVYLTPLQPAARTVFHKPVGGTEFVFRNEHAEVAPTPFNADRWISPSTAPGDLLLFPSYLLHSVPPNPGGRRITLSFNAIPGGLDAWGYAVRFGA